MIKSIKKICYKSFDDLDISKLEFKEANFIYGLNGKGKSSFANFLKENIDNNKLDNFECSNETYKLFLYDEMYKKESLYNDEKNFGSFYIGEGVKSIIKKINKIEEKINNIDKKLKCKKEEKSQLENKKGKLETNIAKDTKAILEKIDPENYTTQKYTKKNIEEEGFETAKFLNNDELIAKQKHTMSNVPKQISNFEFNDIGELKLQEIKDMLRKTPENKAIEKFKENPELENFIKTAIHIKNANPNEYNDKCPLCEQSISEIKLWEKLEQHFSEEYNNFIKNLDKYLQFLQNTIKELKNYESWINENLIQNKLLLDSLDSNVNIDELRQRYLQQIENIIDNINGIDKILKDKKNSPNRNDLSLDSLNSTFSKSIEFISKSDEINKIVQCHNKQQGEYESIIGSNIKDIKKHFKALKKNEYEELQNEINKQDRHIEALNKFKVIRNERKIKLEKQLKDDESLKKLGDDLKWFYSDIEFTRESENYYKIQRKNCNGEWIDCKSGLSEGEKTIVSVIYFINFYLSEINKGILEYPILVIDDPITSLDSENRDKIVNYICDKVKENDRGQKFFLSHDREVLCKMYKHFLPDSNKDDKKQILHILKPELKSEIKVSNKNELNKVETIYNSFKKLHNFVNNNNSANDCEINDIALTIRKLIENIFSIYPDDTNFTKNWNQYMKDKEITEQYTADDIHKLLHYKHKPSYEELLNKCKFILKAFKEFDAHTKTYTKE